MVGMVDTVCHAMCDKDTDDLSLWSIPGLFHHFVIMTSSPPSYLYQNHSPSVFPLLEFP